ncbi:WD40-repeat-containing domain protein [Peziza echinospora]|nr:WD40-repeat-containing domain protein [Peziza echinospora]
MGGGRKGKNGRNGGKDSDCEEGGEGDLRTEGMDADVFSQPIGFIPQFPSPPKYIRVRTHNKSQREFNNIFLAQELSRDRNNESNGRSFDGTSTANLPPSARPKGGAIWAMKFNKDGRYLAAGGQDQVVRVWQVISTENERCEHEKEEDAAGTEGKEGTEYVEGGGRRLNAPVFKSEPIQEYYGHTADILDLSWSKNQFLLSSSMDKTVRLWHVTKKECLCCFQHSDFVTSIVFHPIDDRFFLAGSLDSKLRLWSIPDKNVAFWNEVPDLITAVAFSPDGKVAIAGCLSGLCLFYETEGLKYNTQIQVRSSIGRNAKGSKITGIETSYFPPDDPNGEVKLLVTSNDSRIRMYNLRDKSLETKFKGYENTCSQIRATFSGDGKYIICGSEGRKVYIWNVQTAGSEKKNKRPVEYFEAHPAIVTVAILAPSKTRELLGASRDPIYDLCNPPPITLVSKSGDTDNPSSASTVMAIQHSTSVSTNAHLPKVIEEPLSATIRGQHSDGNIIVTADYTGRIKIFRQDCAHLKRKNELWESGSTFSRKLVGRRDSLNRGDHHRGVLSWRSSVASDISIGGSSLRSSTRNSFGAGVHNFMASIDSHSRSVSPRMSMGTINLSGRGGYQTPEGRSRAQSLNSNATPQGFLNGHSRGNSVTSTTDSSKMAHLPVPGSARQSEDSRKRLGNLGGISGDTSMKDGYSTEDSDRDQDGSQHMCCTRCGGKSFMAMKSKKDQTRLQCTKCEMVIG